MQNTIATFRPKWIRIVWGNLEKNIFISFIILFEETQIWTIHEINIIKREV